MDYETFRNLLGGAGLTNKEFADLVKINSNSITNFRTNAHVPEHWAIVAILIGELANHKIEFRHLLRKMNIEPNKVRGRAAKGHWGGSPQLRLPQMPT